VEPQRPRIFIAPRFGAEPRVRRQAYFVEETSIGLDGLPLDLTTSPIMSPRRRSVRTRLSQWPSDRSSQPSRAQAGV
jgi:hypothetical protein